MTPELLPLENQEKLVSSHCTKNCVAKVDTVSGVQQLGTRFKVTMAPSRDSLRFDPRGLSLDNLGTTSTVIRFTGTVASNTDSTVINPLGKVVH